MTEARDDTPRAEAQLDDKPPLLGSWRNIYAVVIGTLVVVVALFTVLTKVYE